MSIDVQTVLKYYNTRAITYYIQHKYAHIRMCTRCSAHNQEACENKNTMSVEDRILRLLFYSNIKLVLKFKKYRGGNSSDATIYNMRILLLSPVVAEID